MVRICILLCLSLGIFRAANAQPSELIDRFAEAYAKYRYIGYEQLSRSERGEGEPFLLYFEKDDSDERIGMRFLLNNSFARFIYNGTELFALGMKYQPGFYLLQNEYELMNPGPPFPAMAGYAESYPAYVLGLSAVRDDDRFMKTLEPDTMIDGLRCTALRVHSEGVRILGSSVYAFPPSVSVSFDMIFYIDEQDYLLRQVDFSNSFGSHSVTRYVNYRFDGPREGLAWYLNDYPEATEYVRIDYVPLKKGTKIPEFEFRLADGKTLSQHELEGKKAFLFFWNSGCDASRASVPVVNSLMEKYPEVVFLGLNNEERETAALQQARERDHMRFTLALGGRETAYAFGVDSWPTFLVFDENGVLTGSLSGYGDNLEEELERMLEER